jgi:predicted nucleic acid-binding protein
MQQLFADASYWIALLNPRDDLHKRTDTVLRDLGSVQIVTSEMVLTEFLNSFSDYGSHLRRAAAQAVLALRDASQITIVPQTSQLFGRALELYENVSDKTWSLTDCTSFLIMRDAGITAALTHDRHFVQAGFQALLR